MSKDFSEYLTSQSAKTQAIDIDMQELEKVFEQQQYQLKWWQILMGNTITTTALSIITQPLQVIYTTQQLSIKKIDFQINNIKDIMEAKITIAQQKRLEQMLNYKPISYKGATYQNYSQAIKGIAEQGILGFFKGLGTGITYQITNSQLRYLIIQRYFNERKLMQNLYTSGVALCVDIITNPLMLFQSRMILQNRLPNFRTYPSLIDLLKQEKNYFKGSFGHIYKHLALFTFQAPSLFLNDQRVSLGYLLIIQQIVSYPFLTVIRRLQCQCKAPFMLQTEYNGFFDSAKQIYQQEGIRKFYGGFLTFTIANTFISFVLYSTQLLGEAQD